MSDFVSFEVSQPVIDRLRWDHAIPVSAHLLLQAAMAHGGYVAGGFARLVAKQLLSIEDGDVRQEADSDELGLIVSTYLGHYHLPLGNVNKKYRHGSSGDIDVWFPDARSLAAFETDSAVVRLRGSEHRCYVVPTQTKCADEYVIDEHIRVQAIRSWLMPAEQQLARFDIANVMVAFTGKRLLVHRSWFDLERHHVLHVANWTSPYTPVRVFKYLEQRGLHTVTPETAEQLCKRCIEAVTWAKQHPGDRSPPDVLTERVARTSARHFLQRMRKAAPALSMSDLLLLSAMNGAESYGGPKDWAKAEVNRRVQP